MNIPKPIRKIIHIDMDAFYASVEQRDNPEYRNRAIIVGGRPEQRGVVAACSYEARAFGIHSAMSSSKAIRLCPEAIFLAPRFNAYRECSQGIHKIFHEFTELIEPLSLDEAYLDVSECQYAQGSATLIAKEIKYRIKERLNLIASAGVSYNKFLAKIASDMDKPDGLYVIKPEDAQDFIAELPIRKFFGVGKVTEKKMHKLNIFTGADLKVLELDVLEKYFGKSGRYYYEVVRGNDTRPVNVSRQRKSIGKETTFQDDLLNKSEIYAVLKKICVQLADILKNKMLHAKTVVLKVKYDNFQLITRSKTLEQYIATEKQILDVLPELLKKTAVGERPIRLIGVSLNHLERYDDSDSSATSSHASLKMSQLGLFKL